jgi:hypothetical protein
MVTGRTVPPAAVTVGRQMRAVPVPQCHSGGTCVPCGGGRPALAMAVIRLAAQTSAPALMTWRGGK